MACSGQELLDLKNAFRWSMPGAGHAMVAAALVIGEAAGFHMPLAVVCWPCLLGAAALAALVAAGWSIRWCAVPIAAVAGLALAGKAESSRRAVERYARVGAGDGSPPVFEMVVEEDGRCRRGAADGRLTADFRSTLGGIPVKVVLPVERRDDVPVAGERWRCSGWLSLKKDAPSRYSPHTLWVVDSSHACRMSAAERISPHRAYRAASDRIAGSAGKGLGWNGELASIAKAILLGRRADVPRSKRSAFAAAGTVHVFAISGLHVMLIAALIEALLSRAGLSRMARSAMAIPMLAAYVMLSGARPSAVRAAIMVSLWIGARMAGRRPDSLAALGTAAIVVYGMSPVKIFDVGCALSFSVMLGIVLWIRWTERFSGPADILLAAAAKEQSLGASGRAGALLACWRRASRVFAMLGISFAAWMAGTPVAAMAFGRISLCGPVVNLAVVPLAAMSVVLSAAGAGMSAVSAAGGALFNNLAALCIWMMERISEKAADIPYASIDTVMWGWKACFLWYAGWIALLAAISHRLKPRSRISVRTWELQ